MLKFRIILFVGVVVTVATLNFLVFFHEYVNEQEFNKTTAISTETP